MIQNSYIDKMEYNAVDVAKLVASILVITIHTLPFGSSLKFIHMNYYWQNSIARLAVPLFFISTGFFLFKGQNPEQIDSRLIIKSAVKMLKMYILWSIIYLPIKINQISFDFQSIQKVIKTYIYDFFLRESFSHLWYLKAAFWGIVITFFLVKKGVKHNVIVLISLGLYCIGLFGQSWYGIIASLEQSEPRIWYFFELYHNIFGTTRNGLFEGFLFVSIGMSFALKPKQMKIGVAISGFLISVILLLREVVLVFHLQYAYANDMYLFLVPSSYFLFYIIICIRMPYGNICYFLRKLSSLIYFIHPLVLYVISNIARINHFEVENGFLFSLPIILLVSSLLILLSDKCKWLKKLF